MRDCCRDDLGHAALSDLLLRRIPPLNRVGGLQNRGCMLKSPGAVALAVEELQAQGIEFVHEARTEAWGQTVARFMSPEGVLIGLSYAPWLHP